MTNVLNIALLPNVHAPRAARAALESLAPALPRDTYEDLKLLVTELVTNSIRHAADEKTDQHARAAIDLLVDVAPTRVRVAVSDEGPGFPPELVGVAKTSTRHFGLMLLGLLSHRWGVEKGKETFTTWFEIDLAARAIS